jgi:hypothetical protein
MIEQANCAVVDPAIALQLGGELLRTLRALAMGAVERTLQGLAVKVADIFLGERVPANFGHRDGLPMRFFHRR